MAGDGTQDVELCCEGGNRGGKRGTADKGGGIAYKVNTWVNKFRVLGEE